MAMNKSTTTQDDWKTYRLGDVCTVVTGKHDVNHENPKGQYPFFTCAQDIHKIDEYSFDDEAVLVAGNGFFNVKYYNGKFDAYQRTYVLHNFIDKIEPKYIYQLIRFKLDEITKDNRGSTIRYIRLGDLTEQEFKAPERSIQKNIVSRFEEIENDLLNSQSKIQRAKLLIQKFRQAVLSAAVTGKLTEDWREKNLQSKLTFPDKFLHKKEPKHLFKLNHFKLLDIPESWKWSQFWEYSLIKSNLVNPKDYSDHILVAPDNIERDTGILLEKKLVSEINPISSKHFFEPNSIIYSKIRPYLNKLTLVDFEGLCSADMYPVITSLNIEYLAFYMLSFYFLTTVSNIGDRTLLPKINQPELYSVPVPVPSMEEQQEIIRKAKSLMEVANQAEQQIENAEKRVDKLTQSILAKAFRGELV